MVNEQIRTWRNGVHFLIGVVSRVLKIVEWYIGKLHRYFTMKNF